MIIKYILKKCLSAEKRAPFYDSLIQNPKKVSVSRLRVFFL